MCVNPAHLEPVPGVVNNHRGFGICAKNMRKSECVNGHPFAGDNLKFTRKGRRVCRACLRINKQRWRERAANALQNDPHS